MDVEAKYNATVVSKSMLSDGLFTMRVKPDREVPEFVPGQYVLLGLSSDIPRMPGSQPEFRESKPGRLILRAYSIASSGYDTGIIEFYISLVSNGSLTPRLIGLQPGDRLNLGDKIRGHFTLETVPPEHDAVILAGTGTGIAPYISMLRAELVRPHPFKLIVLHGGRFQWELGYLTEFKLHESFSPNVRYLPVISRPGDDPAWDGLKGRLTPFFQTGPMEDAFGVPLDPRHTSVFLCGNPQMIHDISEVLHHRGYTNHTTESPGSLHVEEYW